MAQKTEGTHGALKTNGEKVFQILFNYVMGVVKDGEEKKRYNL